MIQSKPTQRVRFSGNIAPSGVAILLLLLCLSPVVHSAEQGSENRSALVIGNAQYSESPLRNPGNDARDMADALGNIGFDVTLAVDVDRRGMGKAIRDFGKKLRARGGVGLFYYAGHGLQIDSRNYMIPVDAPMAEEDEVPYESVDVGSVLAKMESAGNALNIIILDACRNNPFPSQFRSTSRGLARVEAPIGSLVVYSTAPGSIADDGKGRNGIFTGHLLDQLRTPGLSLSETVRRTRAAVVKATNRAQVPWESSSLLTDIEFTNPVGATIAGPTPKPSPTLPKPQPVVAVPKQSEEQAAPLTIASRTRSLTVDVTPESARVRIMNIVPSYQPGIELDPERVYDVLVTHPDFEPWRDDIKLIEADNRVSVALAPKAGTNAYIATRKEPKPAQPVQLGSVPRMFTVSGGSFSMGCSKNDKSCEKYEKPSVKVAVKDFKIAKTEVTVGQFSRFVNATRYITDAERGAGGFDGCYVFEDNGGISRATSGWAWDKSTNWKNPGYVQSDDHPVTCVSWNDAIAYINWLTSTTGDAMRLPSEAEWEFAARAGTATRYQNASSASELCGIGNGADKTQSPKGSRWSSRANCSDGHWFSAPVASFSPNANGLYDMQGNVWEWVADTWTSNHKGARADGKAVLSGDRKQRVLRGGGWDGGSRQQRLSARRLGQVASRTSMIGFRVVAD